MDLTKLIAVVAEQKTLNESAAALIRGLADRLREAAASEVQVLALADELDAANDDLTAAVSENTTPPAPPAPPVV